MLLQASYGASFINSLNANDLWIENFCLCRINPSTFPSNFHCLFLQPSTAAGAILAATFSPLIFTLKSYKTNFVNCCNLFSFSIYVLHRNENSSNKLYEWTVLWIYMVTQLWFNYYISRTKFRMFLTVGQAWYLVIVLRKFKNQMQSMLQLMAAIGNNH